jgi:uncharacterized phage infection (PIP) family protein YhgE
MSKTLDVDGTTFTPNQIRRLESALAREHAEVERLKKQYTDHLELDADEDTEFQAKYNMRVSERNAALRYRDDLQAELNTLREQLKNEQDFNKILVAQLDDLRNGAIAEYQLRVRAEAKLRQQEN